METIEYRGFTIRIEQDDDPVNPREWKNVGVMFCQHPRYNLGDEDASLLDYRMAKRNGDVAVELSLFLLDHSGLTLRTFHGDEYMGLDTSRVGVIYVTRETLHDEYGIKCIAKDASDKAIRVLQSEVAIYDSYLNGDVYGYVIEDEDGEHIDSCWGYYGWDCEKSGLMDAARSYIDWYVEKLEREAREYNQRAIEAHARQVKIWIRNRVPLIYRESLVLPYPGA